MAKADPEGHYFGQEYYSEEELLQSALKLAYPCCYAILHDAEEAREVALSAAEDFVLLRLSGWREGEPVPDIAYKILGKRVDIITSSSAPYELLCLKPGCLVIRLARRLAEARLKARQRQSRRQTHLDDSAVKPLCATCSNAADHVLQHELLAHTLNELAHLRPQSRALLETYLISGKTQEEMAREEGVSQATISRRVNRAMEDLRKAIRERLN